MTITDSEVDALKEGLEKELSAREKAIENHKKRAEIIAVSAEFIDITVSKDAYEGLKIISENYQRFTEMLALYLPDGWRTSKCLETLEESCMWAKKSIRCYDRALSKEQNDNTSKPQDAN